jgi:hypothetical protein
MIVLLSNHASVRLPVELRNLVRTGRLQQFAGEQDIHAVIPFGLDAADELARLAIDSTASLVRGWQIRGCVASQTACPSSFTRMFHVRPLAEKGASCIGRWMRPFSRSAT